MAIYSTHICAVKNNYGLLNDHVIEMLQSISVSEPKHYKKTLLAKTEIFCQNLLIPFNIFFDLELNFTPDDLHEAHVQACVRAYN